MKVFPSVRRPISSLSNGDLNLTVPRSKHKIKAGLRHRPAQEPMKPSTPETARRRRSPARRRPSEAAGALDFGAVDQPSAKTESDRKGMLSRVAIAVLSIVTAVAAAYFCADVMGTEVSIVDGGGVVRLGDGRRRCSDF